MKISSIYNQSIFKGTMNINTDKDTIKSLKIASKTGAPYSKIWDGVQYLEDEIKENTPDDTIYTLNMNFDSNNRAWLNMSLKNNQNNAVQEVKFSKNEKDYSKNFTLLEKAIYSNISIEEVPYENRSADELRNILKLKAPDRNFEIRSRQAEDCGRIITIFDLNNGETFEDTECSKWYSRKMYGNMHEICINSKLRAHEHKDLVDYLTGAVLAPSKLEEFENENKHNVNNGKILISDKSLKNLEKAFALSYYSQDSLKKGFEDLCQKLNCETSPDEQFEIQILEPYEVRIINYGDWRAESMDKYERLNYRICNKTTNKNFNNYIDFVHEEIAGDLVPRRCYTRNLIDEQFADNMKDYQNFEYLKQLGTTTNEKVTISEGSLQTLRNLRNNGGNFSGKTGSIRDIWRAICGNMISLSERLYNQTPENKKYEISASDIYNDGDLYIALEDSKTGEVYAKGFHCTNVGEKSYNSIDSQNVWEKVFKPIHDEIGLKY